MAKRSALSKERQVQSLEGIIASLNLLLEEVKGEGVAMAGGETKLETYEPLIGWPTVTLEISVTWMPLGKEES